MIHEITRFTLADKLPKQCMSNHKNCIRLWHICNPLNKLLNQAYVTMPLVLPSTRRRKTSQKHWQRGVTKGSMFSQLPQLNSVQTELLQESARKEPGQQKESLQEVERMNLHLFLHPLFASSCVCRSFSLKWVLLDTDQKGVGNLGWLYCMYFTTIKQKQSTLVCDGVAVQTRAEMDNSVNGSKTISYHSEGKRVFNSYHHTMNKNIFHTDK